MIPPPRPRAQAPPFLSSPPLPSPPIPPPRQKEFAQAPPPRLATRARSNAWANGRPSRGSTDRGYLATLSGRTRAREREKTALTSIPFGVLWSVGNSEWLGLEGKISALLALASSELAVGSSGAKHGAVRRRGEGVRRRVDHQTPDQEGSYASDGNVSPSSRRAFTMPPQRFPPFSCFSALSTPQLSCTLIKVICVCLWWHAGSDRVPCEMEGLVPQVSPAHIVCLPACVGVCVWVCARVRVCTVAAVVSSPQLARQPGLKSRHDGGEFCFFFYYHFARRLIAACPSVRACLCVCVSAASSSI